MSRPTQSGIYAAAALFFDPRLIAVQTSRTKYPAGKRESHKTGYRYLMSETTM